MNLRRTSRSGFFWKKPIGDKCLGSCGLEKEIRIQAPGPDGFTVAFWQACWDFAKEEIVELFKEFYDQKSLAKSLNATFLVIIPKKEEERKGAGVQIDMRSLRQHQLELPYEGLEKDGLWVTLDGLDVWCFSMAKFLSLLTRFQQASSPALSAGKFISSCRLKGRGDAEIMVSHLLFADDTILFCEASKDQLTHLGWILAWFEAASRLRINLAKSELIPVGEIDNIEEMAVGIRLQNRKLSG
ncbi:hypothetical protein CK203_038566 [Vitis vinifera]|uniref:Reverse transcriptase domain-containing protein n=1 Tax=Vitis vinifera TaxID=29760 RepID=A0A438I419_VITVI|nr:hypothetical protein CK203_038566 [Vitis vinifera]